MKTKKPTAAIRKLTQRILPHVLSVLPADAGAELMATALAYELRGKSPADFEAWIDSLQELARKVSLAARKQCHFTERKRPRGYRALQLPGSLALLAQEDAELRTCTQVEHNRVQALAALNLACALYIDLCTGPTQAVSAATRMVVMVHRGHPMRYVVAAPSGDDQRKLVRKAVRREVRRQSTFDPAELHQPLLFAALKRQGLGVWPQPADVFDVESKASDDR